MALPFDPLVVAEPFSWLLVATFLLAGLLDGFDVDDEIARRVGVVAWVAFALFWAILIPHFVFAIQSIVETVGSLIAVPLCLLAAKHLADGRDSLLVLTRAVGIMGVLYLPLAYLPLVADNPVRQWLIEVVTDQTQWALSLIGVTPEVTDAMTVNGDPIPGKTHPYENTFVFDHPVGPITYTIVTACTGIGSMSIFAGGILAVRAPVRRKLAAAAVSIPVIYVLNIGRNVFIATAFGEQRMQVLVGPVLALFGSSDPRMVSYFVADRLLAQFGSVVVMVVITWLVVRQLPELAVVVEDMLYLATGTEYDLVAVFGAQPRVADGGEVTDGEHDTNGGDVANSADGTDATAPADDRTAAERGSADDDPADDDPADRSEES